MSLKRARDAEPEPRPPALATSRLSGLSLECYRQASGYTDSPDAHVHEDVQISLNVNVGGGYRYRGAMHPVAAGEICFIASGEAHRPGDGAPAPEGGVFRTLYVPAERWRSLTGELFGRGRCDALPPDHVISDEQAVARLLSVHAGAEAGVSGLEADCLAEEALRLLAQRLFARDAVGPRECPDAVRRAREYIEAHAHDPFSLEELSRVAGLSPVHLCRSFKTILGLPPNRYMLALRISRAKSMLSAGRPISDVAASLGFADQAHLTRRFVRMVGVTPGRYASGTKGRLRGAHIVQ